LAQRAVHQTGVEKNAVLGGLLLALAVFDHF
jgi:hypothetical protein